MLDVFADVLADVLIPDGWRNRDGEVYGRWLVLLLLLAFAVVAVAVFGLLRALGGH